MENDLKRDDLIRRSALLQDIDDTVRYATRDGMSQFGAEIRGANKVIARIEAAPPVDAVEVVRCRECERWDAKWDDGEEHNCKADASCHPGWWYCPWGQRREEDS